MSNRFRHALFLVILTLHLSEGESQNVYPNKSYFGSYWRDTKDIVSAPFKWKTKEFLTVGLILGGAVILYTQDEQIRKIAERNQSQAMDNVTDVLSPLGKYYSVLGYASAAYIYGLAEKNQNVQAKSLILLKTILITAAFTYAVKSLTHRARPYQENDSRLWEGPFGTTRYSSFPSGHTTATFTIATFLLKETKSTFVKVMGYTIASLVALSRVYDDKHWSSDIYIGAVLGTAIASSICNCANWSVEIQPTSLRINF